MDERPIVIISPVGLGRRIGIEVRGRRTRGGLEEEFGCEDGSGVRYASRASNTSSRISISSTTSKSIFAHQTQKHKEHSKIPGGKRIYHHPATPSFYQKSDLFFLAQYEPA